MGGFQTNQCCCDSAGFSMRVFKPDGSNFSSGVPFWDFDTGYLYGHDLPTGISNAWVVDTNIPAALENSATPLDVVACDNGDVVVATTRARRGNRAASIWKFSSEGNLLWYWDCGSSVSGLAVDSVGNIYAQCTPVALWGIDQVLTRVASLPSTIKIQYGWEVTESISTTSSMSQVQSALEALSTIGVGNVSVSGSFSTSLRIRITSSSVATSDGYTPLFTSISAYSTTAGSMVRAVKLDPNGTVLWRSNLGQTSIIGQGVSYKWPEFRGANGIKGSGGVRNVGFTSASDRAAVTPKCWCVADDVIWWTVMYDRFPDLSTAKMIAYSTDSNSNVVNHIRSDASSLNGSSIVDAIDFANSSINSTLPFQTNNGNGFRLIYRSGTGVFPSHALSSWGTHAHFVMANGKPHALIGSVDGTPNTHMYFNAYHVPNGISNTYNSATSITTSGTVKNGGNGSSSMSMNTVLYNPGPNYSLPRVEMFTNGGVSKARSRMYNTRTAVLCTPGMCVWIDDVLQRDRNITAAYRSNWEWYTVRSFPSITASSISEHVIATVGYRQLLSFKSILEDRKLYYGGV